jgi:hypothetical protein
VRFGLHGKDRGEKLNAGKSAALYGMGGFNFYERAPLPIGRSLDYSSSRLPYVPKRERSAAMGKAQPPQTHPLKQNRPMKTNLLFCAYYAKQVAPDWKAWVRDYMRAMIKAKKM